MTTGAGSHFLPKRLPAVTDRWHGWLRPLWLAVLVLALLLDAAGTVFVLRDAYVHDPQFARLGLISQVENDGSVTIEGRPRADGGAPSLAVNQRRLTTLSLSRTGRSPR